MASVWIGPSFSLRHTSLFQTSEICSECWVLELCTRPSRSVEHKVTQPKNRVDLRPLAGMTGSLIQAASYFKICQSTNQRIPAISAGGVIFCPNANNLPPQAFVCY
jgi:hypothetical protein